MRRFSSRSVVAAAVAAGSLCGPVAATAAANSGFVTPAACTLGHGTVEQSARGPVCEGGMFDGMAVSPQHSR